jgi:hypothetical protein
MSATRLQAPKPPTALRCATRTGAGDEDRTRDPLLGKHDPDKPISGISGQGLGLAYERVNPRFEGGISAMISMPALMDRQRFQFAVMAHVLDWSVAR